MKKNRFLSYAASLLLFIVIGQYCRAVSQEDADLIQEFDSKVESWERTWGYNDDDRATKKDERFEELLGILQKLSGDINKDHFILGVGKKDRENPLFDLDKFVPPAHSPLVYLALFYAPKIGRITDEPRIIQALKDLLKLFSSDAAKARALRLKLHSYDMMGFNRLCQLPFREGKASHHSCPLIFYLLKYQTSGFIRELFASFADQNDRNSIITTSLVEQRIEVKKQGFSSKKFENDEVVSKEVPDEADASKTKTVTETVQVKYEEKTTTMICDYFYYSPLYFAAIACNGAIVRLLLSVLSEDVRNHICTTTSMSERYEEILRTTFKEDNLGRPFSTNFFSKDKKIHSKNLIVAIIEEVGQLCVQGPLDESLDAILSYNYVLQDYFPTNAVWNMFCQYVLHHEKNYSKSKPCPYETINPGECSYCQNDTDDFFTNGALRSCKLCLVFLKYTDPKKRDEEIIEKGMLRKILAAAWFEIKDLSYTKSNTLDQYEAKSLVDNIVSLLSDDAACDRAITEQGDPDNTTALHWAALIARDQEYDYFLKNFIEKVSDKKKLEVAMNVKDGYDETVLTYYPEARRLFEEQNGLGVTITKLNQSLKVLKEKLQKLLDGLEALKKGLEKPA